MTRKPGRADSEAWAEWVKDLNSEIKDLLDLKQAQQRDTIMELRVPTPDAGTFTSNSKEMAEIAALHYDSVQCRDLDVPNDERAECTRNLLERVNRIPYAASQA